MPNTTNRFLTKCNRNLLDPADLATHITRRELFVSNDARMSIRLHDTRATFITLALANGKSESWVQDRTGHRSSDMINRYRRVARTAAELGLGDLLPMNEAIRECGGKSQGFP